MYKEKDHRTQFRIISSSRTKTKSLSASTVIQSQSHDISKHLNEYELSVWRWYLLSCIAFSSVCASQPFASLDWSNFKWLAIWTSFTSTSVCKPARHGRAPIPPKSTVEVDSANNTNERLQLTRKWANLSIHSAEMWTVALHTEPRLFHHPFFSLFSLFIKHNDGLYQFAVLHYIIKRAKWRRKK